MQLAIAAVLSFCALESEAQTYCSPLFGSGCTFGDQIENFSTIGGQTNIINNGSGCSTGNYTYDSTQLVTTLPGGSFDISVQAGSAYSQGFAIWVDWNNNGTLTDPGELVYTSPTWATTPFSGTVTVPNLVTYGTNLRMRVRCSWNSIPTDPCANQSYGEVEDYNLIVLPPAANDAGVASIDTPLVSSCTLANSLWVTLNNSGTDTLSSATINWSVNGTAQTPVLWSGAIVPSTNDTMSTFVGNYTFAIGDVIEVYTTMPNGVLDSLPQNDTIVFTVPPLSLNGVYTIDSLGTGLNNYQSFTQAVNDLNLVGVCGPVTFNVANDTYADQQVLFNNIAGTSTTNTITFQSASGDTSQCVVEYTSQGGANLTYDGVVRFNTGASNIHFKNIKFYNPSTSSTYATVVSVNGDANNISFEGCRLQNDQVLSGSNQASLVYKNGSEGDNATFEGCSFVNGSYGVYWYGSSSLYDQGLEMTNNEFVNQRSYGSYLYYQDNVHIENNTVTSNTTSTFGYGFSMWYFSGDIKLKNNHVYQGVGSSWPTYGFYIVNWTGDFMNPADVSGNVISMPNGGTYGTYMSNALFVDFANNSILFEDASSFDEAVYITNGAANRFFNNVVSAGGNALTMYVSGVGIAYSDNNAFTGSNGITWNGSHSDINSLTAATEMDSNSVWLTGAAFADSMNLRTCNDSLDGTGTDNLNYLMDLQGDPAMIGAYDIGADQFATALSFDLQDTVGLCSGGVASLEAWYYDTIVWNNTDTGNYYQTNTPGSVVVQGSGLCGVGTDTVIVSPAPLVDLPANSVICLGGTGTIDAGISNASYAWSTGETTQSIIVTSTGSYSVTVTDQDGCVSDDMTTADLSVPVSLNAEEILCDGGSITLDAGISGGTYNWSTGETTQAISVSTSGAVSVTVTDGSGCVSDASTDVIDVAFPAADFTSSSSNYSASFNNQSSNGESYLWLFGDGDSSTVENPSHIYPWSNQDSVEFTVTLITSNACGSDTSVSTVYVGDAVSVNEIAEGGLVSMYPNPAKGEVNISFENVGGLNEVGVSITDLQGKIVLTSNFNLNGSSKVEVLDISKLSTGFYLVSIEGNGHSITEQLIVE
jgi:hypothetical protein